MKKSGWLMKIVPALFAAALLASCDSGGGGGSGGGTAASNKSSITVKIGSSGSSADILGDFGPAQSDNFYYGVSYSGAGKSDGPKYGGKGDPITFDDVPYGSYTFSLDIYTDSTRKITLDTKTTSASVSGSYTEVKFNLLYSEYENFYIVSDATSLWAALSGQKINGEGAIDKGNMVAGDETTYAKIYVTKNIDVSGEAMDDGLVVEEGIYCAVVNLGGNKVTFGSLPVNDNVNAVFKDGSVVAERISLYEGASLSFDKVALSQPSDAEGALVFLSGGTLSFSNGSTVEGSNTIVDVSGGTLTLDDTKVTCSGQWSDESDGPTTYAVTQSAGTVTMTGGASITGTCAAVKVEDGSFTMDASSAESTFSEGVIAGGGIVVVGGSFVMTGGSSVESNFYGIYQSGGTVVVNDSLVASSGSYGECQVGGTFVLGGGTVTTGGDESNDIYMWTAGKCVTALVQSYTLGGKIYRTEKANSVGNLLCQVATDGGNSAYILFGGDSMIDDFSFDFRSGATGQIYFGQVAETRRSRFVSFTKTEGNNPRVLISSNDDVEGFDVMDLTVNEAQPLFLPINDGTWSNVEYSNGYYTLSGS